MSASAGDFAFGVSIQCGPTPASAGARLPDETGYRGKNGSRNDVFTCVERQEEPKRPNQQRTAQIKLHRISRIRERIIVLLRISHLI